MTEGNAVTALIFNTGGRVVRRLYQGRLPAGVASVPWDGRDDQGRVVAAGVYFARVETPEYASIGRVVVLRGPRE